MTGSLTALLLAAILFVASHLGLSSTALRPAIVQRIGERGFLGLYSLLSIVLLVWTGFAYGAASNVELWIAGPVLRSVPLILMPFAFVFLFAALSQPNPTAVMQEDVLRRPDAARGIFAVTRHPVMWAVTLWAVSHLAANGDLATLILTGSMAFLALAGMRLMDRKKAAKMGADWERFAAETSLWPRLGKITGVAWWRIAVGLVLFWVVFLLHGWLFGVSPLPG